MLKSAVSPVRIPVKSETMQWIVPAIANHVYAAFGTLANEIAPAARIPVIIAVTIYNCFFKIIAHKFCNYVNRLYAGVKRNIKRPFRFICFTENSDGIRDEVEVHPLPVVPFEDAMVTAMTTGKRRGAWRKVTMMKPDEVGLEGPTLVMDLDVVVSGPMDGFFDHAPGKICMGRDWLERRRRRVGGHGSVYRFDPGKHDFLYTEFEDDIQTSIAYKGEQRYISLTAHKYKQLEYFPDGWICSFKRQGIPILPLNFFIEPRLPEKCRVMCFHGDPKMEEAIIGAGTKLRYKTRPAKWLRELWLDGDERDWMPS